MEKKDQSTIGAYVDLFLRRKLLFGGVFVALFALLGAGAMSVKTSFRAESLLAIGEGENMGLLPMNPYARQRAATASASLSGKTYATIVEGVPMAEAIATRLSNDSLKVDTEFIHHSVSAEFYEPEVLQISATAKEKWAAIEIANAAADAFIQFNRGQIRSEIEEGKRFVEHELADVQEDLRRIQQDVGEFKKREQVTDLDVEAEQLLGAVTDFQRARELTEADRAEQRAKYASLEKLLFEDANVRMSPIESPAMRGLVTHLAELEGELELARAEYGPDHPRRKLLEKQVATVRAQIENASTEVAEPAPVAADDYYSTIRKELTQTAIRLVGLDARIGALDGAIGKSFDRLAELPPKQSELRPLLLREDVTEAKFRRLLERLEEMELEIEGIQGNASLLDRAVDARPTVSRAMLLVYVAVLSMIGAVGAVLTLEYRDNTIKSPDVITNVLRLTNFGAVPKIKQMGRQWMEESATNHAFEHYRKLRANVRFSSVKKPIRCLLVTSSGPGEGKSSTTANLGLALSQMDQRVLLVDTDLRRPSLMRHFDMDPTPGVTDVLTGERTLEATIRETGFPNLHILTSGPIPPNPAELFESDTMTALVQRLREHANYDMIVFDSAPTLLTTDTPVLAAKMDGVLVVLEAGKTTEEQGLMTKEMLTNAGARVIGAVLNKARGKGGAYYYYGGDHENGAGPSGPNGGGIMGSIKNLGERIKPGA